MRLLNVLFMSICVWTTSLSACMAPVMDEVWIQQGAHEDVSLWLKRDNVDGVVGVYDQKQGTLQWQAKIKDFNNVFSQVSLSWDGKYLVHVRGNQIVKTTDEVGIAVYTKSEATEPTLVECKVSTFIDALQMPPEPKPDEPVLSIAPTPKWIAIFTLGEAGVTLKTVAGKTYTVAYSDGAVQELKPE